MLFNSHKKLVSHFLSQFIDEVMTYRLGFGKMEKMRAVGRIEALTDVLEFCGISPHKLQDIKEKTIQTADSNLLHYK